MIDLRVWEPKIMAKNDLDWAEITKLQPTCFGFSYDEVKRMRDELAKYKKRGAVPEAKKILKNGDYMTVLWADGTKTIVKRAADEAESDYAAFTAALGIKCFGSNSALKRIVATAEEQGKKKKKKKQSEGEILRGLEDIKEGNREAYKATRKGL